METYLLSGARLTVRPSKRLIDLYHPKDLFPDVPSLKNSNHYFYVSAQTAHFQQAAYALAMLLNLYVACVEKNELIGDFFYRDSKTKKITIKEFTVSQLLRNPLDLMWDLKSFVNEFSNTSVEIDIIKIEYGSPFKVFFKLKIVASVTIISLTILTINVDIVMGDISILSREREKGGEECLLEYELDGNEISQSEMKLVKGYREKLDQLRVDTFQGYLKQLGLYEGKIDGIVGHKTKKAVAEFYRIALGKQLAAESITEEHYTSAEFLGKLAHLMARSQMLQINE